MKVEINHYKWMKKVIGIMVILLPIVPILFGFIGQSNPVDWYTSISATYYTNSCGLMSGILAICSFFFFTYPGYDKRDKIVNKLSALFLLMILIFPCGDARLCLTQPVGLFQLQPSISGAIHNTSAICLFLTFWYNIGYLFTLSAGDLTEKKKKRNLIYKITSWCILVGMAAFPLCFLRILPHIFVLIGEIIILMPCGFSWLVKAEAIKKLND